MIEVSLTFLDIRQDKDDLTKTGVPCLVITVITVNAELPTSNAGSWC